MSNLNHHERLRFNYLLANISYLTPREKEEFDYLNRKRQGLPISETQASPQLTPYKETSVIPPHSKDAPSSRPVSPKKQAKKRLTPKKTGKKKKLKHFFYGFLLFLLTVISIMIFLFFKGRNDAQQEAEANHKAAVVEVFNGEETSDGTNILIMGTDKRVTEQSTDARADTIMVVNIGNKDGKIKMVSFMRDILVNIEGVSADDYTVDNKLNTAFNIGEQNDNQGAELLRETLKRNFDIDIKYYAMVDFETFAEAIDALFPNGVKIDAQFATVDGEEVDKVEVPDDLNMKNGVVPNQTIKVGTQYMDGRTLLNYARFRKDDEGDFGRTKRQQQVMQAVMTQLKNPTKLFTGSTALGTIFALTSTNVPYSFIVQNGLSVISSGQKGIERTTIPENGDWVDAYDIYGGQGLLIDFDSYQKELADLGFR